MVYQAFPKWLFFQPALLFFILGEGTQLLIQVHMSKWVQSKLFCYCSVLQPILAALDQALKAFNQALWKTALQQSG